MPCSSKRTRAPPAIAPPARASSIPRRLASGMSVSASTKTRRSPFAVRAPALRTAEILCRFTRTTEAPSPRATAAVASVEPSSTTMISKRSFSARAESPSVRTVAPIMTSSLYAGTTNEISTEGSLERGELPVRPAKCDLQLHRRTAARILRPQDQRVHEDRRSLYRELLRLAVQIGGQGAIVLSLVEKNGQLGPG